jgi:hypothetical protein
MKQSFIHLSPVDNVIVVIGEIENQLIMVSGKKIRIEGNIQFGHKVAIKKILPGEKIIKCGGTIGTATELILPGSHVHIHNMKSNFMHTYTLKDLYND